MPFSLTLLLQAARFWQSRALALLLALSVVAATSVPVRCEQQAGTRQLATVSQPTADMVGMQGKACDDPCCRKAHVPAHPQQGSACAVHCATAALPVSAAEGVSAEPALLAMVPLIATGVALPVGETPGLLPPMDVPDPPLRRLMPLRI